MSSYKIDGDKAKIPPIISSQIPSLISLSSRHKETISGKYFTSL